METLESSISSNNETNRPSDENTSSIFYNTSNETFCMNVSDAKGNEVELARIEPGQGICKNKFKYIANKLNNWVVYKNADSKFRVVNTTDQVFESKILDENEYDFDYTRIGPGEHIDSSLLPNTSKAMEEWMKNITDAPSTASTSDAISREGREL